MKKPTLAKEFLQKGFPTKSFKKEVIKLRSHCELGYLLFFSSSSVILLTLLTGKEIWRVLLHRIRKS